MIRNGFLFPSFRYLWGTGVRLATAFGVSEPTVRTWIPRFRAEGRQGLQNRSSRPHNLCRQTPAPVVQQIAAELGVSAEVERRFPDHAVQHPRHGSFRLVEELAVHGIQIPSSGARGVWCRPSLQTKHEYLSRLEKIAAERENELNRYQNLDFTALQGDSPFSSSVFRTCEPAELVSPAVALSATYRIRRRDHPFYDAHQADVHSQSFILATPQRTGQPSSADIHLVSINLIGQLRTGLRSNAHPAKVVIDWI